MLPIWKIGGPYAPEPYLSVPPKMRSEESTEV
jgi:hypothetical protein